MWSIPRRRLPGLQSVAGGKRDRTAGQTSTADCTPHRPPEQALQVPPPAGDPRCSSCGNLCAGMRRRASKACVCAARKEPGPLSSTVRKHTAGGMRPVALVHRSLPGRNIRHDRYPGHSPPNRKMRPQFTQFDRTQWLGIRQYARIRVIHSAATADSHLSFW